MYLRCIGSHAASTAHRKAGIRPQRITRQHSRFEAWEAQSSLFGLHTMPPPQEQGEPFSFSNTPRTSKSISGVSPKLVSPVLMHSSISATAASPFARHVSQSTGPSVATMEIQRHSESLRRERTHRLYSSRAGMHRSRSFSARYAVYQRTKLFGYCRVCAHRRDWTM